MAWCAYRGNRFVCSRWRPRIPWLFIICALAGAVVVAAACIVWGANDPRHNVPLGAGPVVGVTRYDADYIESHPSGHRRFRLVKIYEFYNGGRFTVGESLYIE